MEISCLNDLVHEYCNLNKSHLITQWSASQTCPVWPRQPLDHWLSADHTYNSLSKPFFLGNCWSSIKFAIKICYLQRKALVAECTSFFRWENGHRWRCSFPFQYLPVQRCWPDYLSEGYYLRILWDGLLSHSMKSGIHSCNWNHLINFGSYLFG